MPGGYTFERFRAEIDRRVRDVPEFTRRLRPVPLGLDHPIWVRDQHFDIDRHVHRLALPSPGGTRELAELTGHLAGLPLDRSRPLWEMWVIEGYHGDDGHDRSSSSSKMHHATVDGVSGSNLLSHLCSLEPDAPTAGSGGAAEHGLRAGPARAPRPRPGHHRDPAAQRRTPARAVGAAGHQDRRPGPGGYGDGRALLRARARPSTAPSPGTARSPWPTWTSRTSGAIKNATGTTVNDVVLAVAGGALRSYLRDRDELPSTSLLATVPVSVREESKRSSGANKVSALFAKLGTDTEDPLERLQDMAEANKNAKEHHQAISADSLQDWAEFAAPRTFGLAVRAYAGLRLPEKHPVVHNLVISNVPGPPVPLYFMGARIDGLYPLGPVFHGAGLNITVMSNNGPMHVGIIACRESMPDVDDLVRRSRWSWPP